MNVQVHFFKPTGRWYTAEDVTWFYKGSVEGPCDFKEAIEVHTRCGPHRRFAGMTAVCTELNPLGFPQMCVVPE